jgi:hypothetical protein
MITTLPATASLQAKSRVKPKAIRLRGATPDEICNQQKKSIMTLKLMLIAPIIQMTLVLYNEDEAFRNREPHHFVTELFCAIYMLREWYHCVTFLFF